MPRTAFLALGVLVALVAFTALVPTLVISMQTVSTTLDGLNTISR